MAASFSKKVRFNTFRLEVYPFVSFSKTWSMIFSAAQLCCGALLFWKRPHPLRHCFAMPPLPEGEATHIPDSAAANRGIAIGSPFGRAGAQRLRGQGRCREIKNTAIASLLQKLMLIAVQIFFGTELALSVTFGDTSPKGRGKGLPGSSWLSLWESWREAPERASPLG